MKILLLGADGQLGRHLRQTLPALGNVVTSSRSGHDGALPCDLTVPASLRALLRKERPDLVVNAAAYTAVDQAEGDADTAMAINAGVPGIIGSTLAEWNGAVIHYSTDYVFDGKGIRPYLESDTTGPLGVYGQSKLKGEQALIASGVDHLILRTAWVYSLHGRNFLTTMLRVAETRSSLSVVDDQHGTPTSAGFLAEATAGIAFSWVRDASRNERSGIYHLTAAGATTWCGFARQIFTDAARISHQKRVPEVMPIGAVDYPTPATRPAYSVLNVRKVERVFGVTAPDWRQDLGRTLEGKYTSV